MDSPCFLVFSDAGGVHRQFRFRQDMVHFLTGGDPAKDLLLPLDESEVFCGDLGREVPRLADQGDGLLEVGHAMFCVCGSMSSSACPVCSWQ